MNWYRLDFLIPDNIALKVRFMKLRPVGVPEMCNASRQKFIQSLIQYVGDCNHNFPGAATSPENSLTIIRSYLKNVFWPNPPEADQFHFVGASF
jgi:hypothetical protein